MRIQVLTLRFQRVSARIVQARSTAPRLVLVCRSFEARKSQGLGPRLFEPQASLRGGPEIEYCRRSPEGPAAVERRARCGASGPARRVSSKIAIYYIATHELQARATARKRHQTARIEHTVSNHPCMPTSGALWMGRMALML